MAEPKMCTVCDINETTNKNRRCVFCERERAKIYRENNKEKCREANKKWANGDREKAVEYKRKSLARLAEYNKNEPKEKQQERSRKSYEKNKEEVLKRTGEYQRKNKDKVSKYQRRYLELNRDKVNEKKNRRRVRILSGIYEKLSFDVICAKASNICYLCGDVVCFDLEPKSYYSPSLDHIIPVSKGGSHTYDNVALAHLGCNVKKGSKLMEELTWVV